MGIHNFRTYVEIALRWPTDIYEGDRCTKSRTHAVGSAPEIRAHKKTTGGGYFDRVCELFYRRLGVATVGDEVPAAALANRENEQRIYRGICVDLSSFCYGQIVEEVKHSHNQHWLRYRRSPSPVPRDVLDTDADANARNDGEKRRETTGGGSVGGGSDGDDCGGPKVTPRTAKRKRRDLFEESERNTKAIQDSLPKGALRSTMVDAVLEEPLIDLCARSCYDKLFGVIGQETIADAVYFCLHYDENTTSCKWFEQYSRRCTTKQIVVSKESRSRIFMNTIRLVRDRLVFETKARLTDAVLKTTSDPTGRRAAWADRALEFLKNDEFVNDVVLEKLQLSGCGPGSEIRRQRYVSGEGEWKCFYTIHDVSKDRGQVDDTRWLWHVFGNDSDIGLGVLLHASIDTDIRYVSNSRRVTRFAEKHLHDRADAYRALHFLSLCLLGNDYVPRLVNESAKNIAALGEEVNRMLYSEDLYCEQYVGLLSRIFAKVDRPTDTGSGDDSTGDRSSSSLSKAMAYVFARLLLAVYGDRSGGGGGFSTGDTAPVEECFVRFYGTSERQDDDSRPILKKTLHCKDGKDRSFEECFAAFASCTLWYLAYCLFYRNMDKRERQVFQTKHLNTNDEIQRVHDHYHGDYGNRQQLVVPTLPMKNAFEYNERRLHELVRFELTTVVGVRHAIRELTTCSLIGIMENETYRILQK